MRRFSTTVAIAISTLLLISISSAQQTATTSVPNLIRYSETLKDAQGAVPSGTRLGVTIAIYKQQDGGAAVWMETQNVTPDRNGQYSVILGSTTATGLPDDLFSQQEQRWLGAQVQGEAEQARVLLVSVPYAFKAHEAETLGGLPASAFVKAPPTDASGSTSTDAGTAVNALSNAGNANISSKGKSAAASRKQMTSCNPLTASASANYIPLFGPPVCNLVNSAIYQSPLAATLNYIGIGTTIPMVQLDVSGSIRSSAGYQIGGNNVLLINRTLDNLIVGGDSGSINNGEFDTFSGIDAGFTNGTGSANTFSGAQAGYANAQGQGNTFTGTQTGSRNVTGSFNSFFGISAGLQNNADYNTFVGEDAGFLTTAGSNNTFLGAEAGNSNIVGSANTFTGRQAGFNNTASNGSFYGYQAGFNNAARGNSFYGYQAGYSNTTAGGNAFFGYQAGYSNTTGELSSSANTFLGFQAGYSNTGVGGTSNTFVGYQAGYSNGLFSNTFVGYQAGKSNSGYDNTSLGYQAGFNGGLGNISLGFEAGYNNAGDYNTFLGFQAGYYLTGGVNNIFMGYSAGSNNKTADSDIYIGSQGCLPACNTEYNTIRIGSGTLLDPNYITATYIAGIFNSAATVARNNFDFVVCVNPVGGLYGAAPGTMNTCASSFSRNELQKQDAVVATQQDVIKTQQEQIQSLQKQNEEFQQRLSRLESLIGNK
jgi:hypothetical protein